MKKITFLIVLLISCSIYDATAQVTVNYDTTAEQRAFVNGFDFGPDPNPGDTNFAYDPLITSTIDGTNITITPNSAIWADNDETPCGESFCAEWNPFWFSAPETPRKTVEQLTFVEFTPETNPSIFNTELTFTADLVSNTISNNYTVQIFITIFGPGFSNFRRFTTDITNVAGSFSVTAPSDSVLPDDAIIQYGFLVSGVMGDPDDATLGSAQFSQSVLSTNTVSNLSFKVFPNPTLNQWNISSQDLDIESIAILNVLGKRVLNLQPNSQSAIINTSRLNSGVYFAQVKTLRGINSIKLIKQ